MGAIEGQYLLLHGDSAIYGPDDGSIFRMKPKNGWGVGSEIGFQPSESALSFVARLRYGESNKDKEYSSFCRRRPPPPL